MSSEIPFHQTRMGRAVIERDIPRVVSALQDIATELRTLNEQLRQIREASDEPQD